MTATQSIARPAGADTVLWRTSGFVEDGFSAVADDAPIAPDAQPIVSVARWLKERDALIGRNGPIGLVIQPSDKWEALRGDLHRFAVIALAIPKYADGRAFSIGRLLREREHYTGEIRAVGVYIIDQVPMMRRIGFDSFQTADPVLKRQLASGDWPEIPAYLQPVGPHDVPAGTRPWTRRADKAAP
jgi:phosphoadenosine phosphosulfate reductase